jgi:hypothetical protein
MAKVMRSNSRVILEDLDSRHAVPTYMSLSRDEALRLSGELARVANEIGDAGALFDRLHPIVDVTFEH